MAESTHRCGSVRPFRSNADAAPHLGEVSQRTNPPPLDREATMVLCGHHHDIPAYFRPHEGARRLLVLLPGALDRSRFDAAFQRASWAATFDAHVLAVSDPTIMASSTATLGWFQGTNGRPVFDELARWIDHFSSRSGIEPSGVVLYGSSAGGFAGLKLAESLPDATVLALNPQLYVERYDPDHVSAMLGISYPSQGLDEVIALHRDHLHVSASIVDRRAPCCIVQNTYDRVHHRHHLLPFLETAGLDFAEGSLERFALRPGFQAFCYHDFENGHIPPGRSRESLVISAGLAYGA